jgi:amino acid transporter
MLFSLGGAMPWVDFYQFANLAGHDGFAAGHLYETVYAGGFGSVLYWLLMLGCFGGLLTTWNGFFMASPLLLQGMARANLVPAGLAKSHPKYGTPINGIYAVTILSIIGPFLGMGLIDPLTLFAAAGFVLSWLITSASLIMLRKKEPDLNRPYRIPGGTLTAGFALVCMTVLFILLFIPNNPVYMGTFAIGDGKPISVDFLFFGWIIIGFLLYFASAGQRNKYTPEERSAALFENVKKANQS